MRIKKKILEIIKTNRGCGYVMECINCENNFRIKRWDYDNLGRGSFCSNECRGKYQRKSLVGKDNPNWKGGLYELNCMVCGGKKKIKRKELKIGGGKYCSRKCKNLDLPRVKKEYFDKYPEKRKEHSRPGKLNPRWLGGKSFEPYNPGFNKTLKDRIKKRDNDICQLCNNCGKDVHHIDYDKKNSDEKNLITLCKKCNSKVNKNRSYWTNYFSNLIVKKCL